MNTVIKLPIVVLISGTGSNLQAIIQAVTNGLPAKICAVISNQSSAYGLQRAIQADIPTHVVSHEKYPTRLDFEAALRAQIDAYQPSLLVLAGFMRKLTPEFVHHYWGKLINIHPSLLPNHPGLNTHQRVLAAKDTYHGATLHFVTDEIDQGPIICSAKIAVLPKDDPVTLQKKILEIEHRLYPEVLAWFAAGKIKLVEKGVLFEQELLPPQGKDLSPLCAPCFPNRSGS
jgi:phosphoribosylglycinamide formyltransferase 1